MEQLVDELHELVARHVNRDNVRTWLHQSSEQQVRTAIEHTLKQLKQGIVIKSVGVLTKDGKYFVAIVL